MRSYSGETRRICFPSLPKKRNLIGVAEAAHILHSRHTCEGLAGLEQMPESKQNLHCPPSCLSLSLHSDQLGPSAVLCRHNECGDAKNTDAQMEHAALHTFMTYVLA